MKSIFKFVLGVILIIPLFILALSFGGVVLGFIFNPTTILIIMGVLLIISIPGIIIGMITKH